MPCRNLDATILVEEPPDIEVVDGLFYVTDHIGSLTIRRCFRPSTFRNLLAKGSETLAQWRYADLDKVVPLPRH